MIYLFDTLHLDTTVRELRCAGAQVPLEPQVFDLLVYLIEHRDHVVGKDELFQHVWCGRSVSESTLSSRITAVRKAVGDNGRDQRLIRTVSRHGFRFVGTLTEANDTAARENSRQAPVGDEPPPLLSRGDRRPITVLLCDLVFTGPDTHPDDPESRLDVLQSCHQIVTRACEPLGGDVADLASERITVYFGYTGIREEDAECAVRAALCIMESLESAECSEVREWISARITLASGVVVTQSVAPGGQIGQMPAFGEATSVAAQLHTRAAPDQISIADSTRQLVDQLFEYRKLETNGNCHLPVGDVWEVVAPSAKANRFDALRRPVPNVIGREEELDFLLRRWKQALRGEGQVVLITGEAGIGKSHLSSRIIKCIRQQNAAHAVLQCSPLHIQTPLHPVIEHSKNGAGIRTTDSAKTGLKKFSLAYDTILDRKTLEQVASVVFAGTKEQSAEPGISQHFKEEILHALLKQLEHTCKTQPTLLVVEDLHWIDPSSLELLCRAIERAQKLNLLLVLTARPDFSPPWPKKSFIREISLTRFDADEVTALIDQLDVTSALDSDLRALLLQQSDGIPLYVEELTKFALSKPRAFNTAAASPKSSTSKNLNVPAALQSSLLARIDQLKIGKSIARICSAVGPQFSYDLIKDVSDISDEDVGHGLDELINAQIIYNVGSPPNASYNFNHALVHNAVYGSMLQRDRQSLHGRIFDALERRGESTNELLAYHAFNAGRPSKAADLWTSAAALAASRGAYHEAAYNLEAAISAAELADGDPDHILQMYGWVAFTWISAEGYLSEKARHAAQRGIAAAKLRPESRYKFAPSYAEWTLLLATGPQDQALAKIEAVLKNVNALKIKSQAFFANALAGYSSMAVGNLKQADRRLKRAKLEYDPEKHNRHSVYYGHIPGPDLFYRLALLRLLQGKFDAVESNIKDAFNACPKDVGFHAEAQLLMKLCLVSILMRDHNRVATYTKRLREFSQTYSLRVAELVSDLYDAMLMSAAGDKPGIEQFIEASKCYEAEIMPFESAPRWVAQAELLLDANLLKEAEYAHKRAGTLISETREFLAQAEYLRIGGRLEALRNNNDKAAGLYSNAVEVAQSQGAHLWEMRAQSDLAVLMGSNCEAPHA